MTSLQTLIITDESERLAVFFPRSRGHTKAWMQHNQPQRGLMILISKRTNYILRNLD